MNSDFWHARWEEKKLGFNQLTPNTLMQKYFPSLMLKENARVFVPLCGKSIDMIWLSQQGFKVIGVELSDAACVDFFKENELEFSVTKLKNFTHFDGGNITLFAGDFFDLNNELLGKIDAVYDRAALIALPYDMRYQYSAFLMRLLSKHSQMLLLTTSYNQTEMQGPPFSVDAKEIHQLYGKSLAISALYQKAFLEIPGHLKSKGLVSAMEHVFYLAQKP